jgi:hypothetical protein
MKSEIMAMTARPKLFARLTRVAMRCACTETVLGSDDAALRSMRPRMTPRILYAAQARTRITTIWMAFAVHNSRSMREFQSTGNHLVVVREEFQGSVGPKVMAMPKGRQSGGAA